MMPVPSHLRNILIPRDKVLNEELLIGDVICHCGNRAFNVMYPGKTQEYEGREHPCTIEINGEFFFLIKAVCSKNNEEYILFDKDFHGSDGFLCHDEEQANLPRPPLVNWKCRSCNASSHEISVKISSQGKDDFMEVTEEEFDESRWPDAFEWIWITIKCSKCGLVTDDWVDYETM